MLTERGRGARQPGVAAYDTHLARICLTLLLLGVLFPVCLAKAGDVHAAQAGWKTLLSTVFGTGKAGNWPTGTFATGTAQLTAGRLVVRAANGQAFTEIPKHAPSVADGQITAVVRPGGDGQWQVGVAARWLDLGKGAVRQYACWIDNSGYIGCTRWSPAAAGPYTTLFNLLGAAIKPGTDYMLSLKVQGSALTFSVNGQAVDTIHDTNSLPGGSWGLYVNSRGGAAQGAYTRVDFAGLPVRTPPVLLPTFSQITSVAPTSVPPKGRVTVRTNLTVISGTLTNGILDFEIYDGHANKQAQQYLTGITLARGQSIIRQVSLSAPASPGRYRVAVGVFNTAFTKQFFWVNQAGMLTVTALPRPTATASATAVPPSATRAVPPSSTPAPPTTTPVPPTLAPVSTPTTTAATATPAPAGTDVSGTWSQQFPMAAITLVLTQNGTAVTGTFTEILQYQNTPYTGAYALDGSLAGDSLTLNFTPTNLDPLPAPLGIQAWCQAATVTFTYSASNGFAYLKGQLACATAFGIAAGGFLDLQKQ